MTNIKDELEKDIKYWTEWCEHEKLFIDKCTDAETLVLLKNRLASGERLVQSLKDKLEIELADPIP